MPNNQPREKMRTIGGMSIRAEIEARLDVAQEEGRTLGIEQSIAFLRLSGFTEAADALDRSAFTPQEPENGT